MATLKFNNFRQALKGAKTLPAGKYNMCLHIFSRNYENSTNKDIEVVFSLAKKIISKLPENTVVIGIDNSRFLNGDKDHIEVEFKKIVCEEHPDAW